MARLDGPTCLCPGTPTIPLLASRLRQLAKADAAALKAEGRPDRMVHLHQTLRLNFNAELPREVVGGQAFAVHLCIGNEFGLLWDPYLGPIYALSTPYLTPI